MGEGRWRDEVELQPGDFVDVRINGKTVRLSHQQDGDGASFAQLEGRGCALRGEMPGVYYPVAEEVPSR